MTCSSLCMKCELNQFSKVNLSKYHGVCRFHSLTLSSIQKCIHCSSLIPVIFLKTFNCIVCDTKLTDPEEKLDICQNCKSINNNNRPFLINKKTTKCDYCTEKKNEILYFPKCAHFICNECIVKNGECTLCASFNRISMKNEEIFIHQDDHGMINSERNMIVVDESEIIINSYEINEDIHNNGKQNEVRAIGLELAPKKTEFKLSYEKFKENKLEMSSNDLSTTSDRPKTPDPAILIKCESPSQTKKRFKLKSSAVVNPQDNSYALEFMPSETMLEKIPNDTLNSTIAIQNNPKNSPLFFMLHICCRCFYSSSNSY